MAWSTGKLLLLCTALAVLASCDGSSNAGSNSSSSSSSSSDGTTSSSSDGTNGGPCVHNYYEPVLNIDRVIANPANTEISRVSLTEVLHDDSKVELEAWCDLQVEGLCYGLSFEEETAVCSLPCGFGNDEGDWHIEVSAEGYQSARVNLDASYEVFEGGCPSYNDEGSHFELELNES